MIEIELNRFSYICPKLGMLSAPAGVLTLVTHEIEPGGYMSVQCACGDDHKIKTRELRESVVKERHD
jgi:hypothetical protein